MVNILELKNYVMRNSLEELLLKALQNHFKSAEVKENNDIGYLSDKYNKENIEENESFNYFVRNISDIKNNWDKYEWFYNSLNSPESKDTLINLLYAKIFMDKQYLSLACAKSTMYFDTDIFGEFNKEVFIDCGGYTGDTALEFISIDPNYNKVYVFEAEDNSYKKCCENLQYFIEEGKVKVLKNAVYSEECIISFDNKTMSGDSSIDESGETSVNAVKLDDICKDNVSFIKMDIEGSEKQAIMGARNIIEKLTPKMCVCIYHLEDDFWKIPELIKSINSSYLFEIRHHSNEVYSETVLYCIPKTNKASNTPIKKQIDDKVYIALRQLTKVHEYNTNKLKQYIKELLTAKVWFISQIENYKNEVIKKDEYISNLIKGKMWIEEQLESHKKEMAGLKEYIDNLINEKSWLESQLINYKEEQEKTKKYVIELAESKTWLEGQLTNYKEEQEKTKKYIIELAESKTWLEGQLTNYKEEQEKTKKYIIELAESKTWLEGQLDNYKEEHKKTKKYIVELVESKAWLEGQVENYKTDYESLQQVNKNYICKQEELESILDQAQTEISKLNYKLKVLREDKLIKQVIKLKKYNI